MFVKPYIKHNRTTGERYTVYKLVEGYRINRQVTHRIIVSFGRLDELDTDERKKLLGRRVEQLIVKGGNTLSISADWREIVRRMNTQKCVTTSVVNIKQETISIRQCTEPVKEVKAIYDILKYKYQPFTRKKSVVPPSEFQKNNTP